MARGLASRARRLASASTDRWRALVSRRREPSGRRSDPGDRAILRALRAVLDGAGSSPRLVVLATEGGSGWRAAIRRSHRAAQVRVVDHGRGESYVHGRLSAVGRVDVIVVAQPAGDGFPFLTGCLPHVRKGGVMIVRLTGARSVLRDLGDSETSFAQLAEAIEGPAEEPFDPSWNRRLAKRINGVDVGRNHVVVRVGGKAPMPKLREHEADAVLGDRPGLGSVLVQKPAQEFDARCRLQENTDKRDARMVRTYEVPPMSLRTYRDAVCVPGQLVMNRGLVLPDTFRHNDAPYLLHRHLRGVGVRFAQPTVAAEATERLTGSYYYLDSEWPGHFGHLISEQVSRLWALDEARSRAPGLKGLLSTRRPGGAPTDVELRVFAAAGIAAEDLHVIDRPVQVEALYSATPMLSMPKYIHPDIAATWQRLGDALAAQGSGSVGARYIFCSRRAGSRRDCSNAAEVEAFFESRDFAVVYPEDFTINEQVRMFRAADVVAGFAGSALLNLSFCPQPKQVIALAPRTYPARNEYMICAVLGHSLSVVWSRPESPESSQVRHRRASGFAFDFSREGVFLSEVLDAALADRA